MSCLYHNFLSNIHEKASESFLSEVVFAKLFRTNAFDFNAVHMKLNLYIVLSLRQSCVLLIFNHVIWVANCKKVGLLYFNQTFSSRF